MKLMFNKTDFEGHWFQDGEDTTGYTEKVPPDAGHVWDETQQEWIIPEPNLNITESE